MAAVEATTLFPPLLADVPKMQLLVTGLCLAAALLVGAIVIALLGRWRRGRAAEEDCSPGAQLAHFRSLYEAGTISQEEFERLRSLLGGQMRAALGVPVPAKEASPPAESGAAPGAIKRPEEGPNGQRPEEPPNGIRPA